ncbi:hypothetical protein LOK49_LG13G00791 [Camellia lanceoleosa]|uniref:Uncharacterized protein n=1 Tax=Camellia lanceoleosa TaxID=1840588 RepID=A0ACC0FIS5_9ERIC|nr:hypothetical protein LOK49_LG13G00791 [Camellia lanceoleosa]
MGIHTVHGHYTNIPAVMKYCEEHAKLQSKMKKGSGSSSVPSNTNTPAAGACNTGGGKDGASKSSVAEAATSTTVASAAVPKNESSQNTASASLPESESAQNVASALLEGKTTHDPVINPTGENHAIFSATPNLLRCNKNVEERSNLDVHDGADPGKG